MIFVIHPFMDCVSLMLSQLVFLFQEFGDPRGGNGPGTSVCFLFKVGQLKYRSRSAFGGESFWVTVEISFGGQLPENRRYEYS